MKKTLLVLIITAVAGYGMLSYHFILLDSSLKIIKKTGVRYENTFIDARGVKKLEIAAKPDLIKAGVNDILGQVDETVKEKTGQ